MIVPTFLEKIQCICCGFRVLKVSVGQRSKQCTIHVNINTAEMVLLGQHQKPPVGRVTQVVHLLTGVFCTSTYQWVII